MKRVSLVCVVALIAFWACEKETIAENPTSLVEDSDVNGIANDNKRFSQGMCYFYFQFGKRTFFPPTNTFYCNPIYSGICTHEVFCIPEMIMDPCQFVPCWIDFLDPWIIYEKINPEEFISIRDKLKLDIDPEYGSVPFALNKEVMGLQFYAKNALMSFDRGGKAVFTLKDDTLFDAETSKSIGLIGNVVKAGAYPIIFNKENETFNVIVSVKEGFKK